MEKEILIALIALIGVLLSVSVSLLASKNAVNTELRKLRFESKRFYDSKLLEARLSVYPRLYFLLSSFIKEAKYESIRRSTLETLLAQINEWDSKNAVFLSEHSGHVCYLFREDLWELLQKGDEELRRTLSSPDFLKDLTKMVQGVEVAIKSDLGIYGVEVADGQSAPKVIDKRVKYRDDLNITQDG